MLTNEQKIEFLLKDLRRYMNNARRVRRDSEHTPGGFRSKLWERAIVDCKRQLHELGWVSPDEERRIVRLLTEGC